MSLIHALVLSFFFAFSAQWAEACPYTHSSELIPANRCWTVSVNSPDSAQSEATCRENWNLAMGSARCSPEISQALQRDAAAAGGCTPGQQGCFARQGQQLGRASKGLESGIQYLAQGNAELQRQRNELLSTARNRQVQAEQLIRLAGASSDPALAQQTQRDGQIVREAEQRFNEGKPFTPREAQAIKNPEVAGPLTMAAQNHTMAQGFQSDQGLLQKQLDEVRKQQKEVEARAKGLNRLGDETSGLKLVGGAGGAPQGNLETASEKAPGAARKETAFLTAQGFEIGSKNKESFKREARKGAKDSAGRTVASQGQIDQIEKGEKEILGDNLTGALDTKERAMRLDDGRDSALAGFLGASLPGKAVGLGSGDTSALSQLNDEARLLSSGALSEDSADLFERVRAYHRRCERNGCVRIN